MEIAACPQRLARLVDWLVLKFASDWWVFCVSTGVWLLCYRIMRHMLVLEHVLSVLG